MQESSNKPSSSTIRSGSQVNFKNLPEPIMTVVTINWTTNSAVCLYLDELAHKTVRLECAADSLVPVSQPGEKK